MLLYLLKVEIKVIFEAGREGLWVIWYVIGYYFFFNLKGLKLKVY